MPQRNRNQTRKITKAGRGQPTESNFKNFDAKTMITNIKNGKQMRGMV